MALNFYKYKTFVVFKSVTFEIFKSSCKSLLASKLTLSEHGNITVVWAFSKNFKSDTFESNKNCVTFKSDTFENCKSFLTVEVQSLKVKYMTEQLAQNFETTF